MFPSKAQLRPDDPIYHISAAHNQLSNSLTDPCAEVYTLAKYPVACHERVEGTACRT